MEAVMLQCCFSPVCGRTNSATASSTSFPYPASVVSLRTCLHPPNGCQSICSSFSFWKPLVAHRHVERLVARALLKGSIAPLQLESPIGQFLSQILVDHPHLLSAAVEQQLEQLQTDRQAEKHKKELPTSSTDLVLYRRIAEVRAKDRKKAIEEILYALIVQKFVEARVSLVPSLSGSSDSSVRVDAWPSQDTDFGELHSTEAYGMIQNHLNVMLDNVMGDSRSLVQISKLRAGQVYAALVMYGYFLKRIDQRFQLEKSLRSLPDGDHMSSAKSISDEHTSYRVLQFENVHESSGILDEFSTETVDPGSGMSSLRSYILSFDSDTLERYATIRSKESVSIIEKHTEALFGKPEILTKNGKTIVISRDYIKISFAGLQRLLLEAVTFGSFLWDVESYVDSRYHFI